MNINQALEKLEAYKKVIGGEAELLVRGHQDGDDWELVHDVEIVVAKEIEKVPGQRRWSGSHTIFGAEDHGTKFVTIQ
tara:strand:- start:12187 stop:12420 length:234 start_codon:yes stop_codon:yes gene_type:complete